MRSVRTAQAETAEAVSYIKKTIGKNDGYKTGY